MTEKPAYTVEWRPVPPQSKGAQLSHQAVLNGRPDAVMELVLGAGGIRVLLNQEPYRNLGVISLSSGRIQFERLKRAYIRQRLRQLRAEERAQRRAERQKNRRKRPRKDMRSGVCQLHFDL